MTLDPGTLITYAKTLLVDAPVQEVAARTAAGRAYYEAFHACEDLPETLNLPLVPIQKGSGGTHFVLAQQLMGQTALPGDPARPVRIEAMSVGVLLNKSRKARVIADYYLDDTFSGDDAHEVIADVERILPKVTKLRSMSTAT